MPRARAFGAPRSLVRHGASSHQLVQGGLDWFGQPSALTRRPRQPLLAYILLRIPIPCAVVPSPVLHEMVTGVRLATWLTRRKLHIAAAAPYVPRRGSTAGPPGRLYAASLRTNGADCLAPLHGSIYFWVGRPLHKCDCRTTLPSSFLPECYYLQDDTMRNFCFL